MDYDRITSALKAIRAQLDELEQAVQSPADGTLPLFDPDIHEVPVDLDLEGTRNQRNWCALMLWAGLKALNARTGKGATLKQSRDIAEQAGYQDGRAWNRWSGSDRLGHNGRWINPEGERHLAHYYAAVGRRMPDDFLPSR